MESTEIADNLKEAKEKQVEKWVAIYIAVLAVLLAICSMGGDNATKDATRTNILASDTWTHYQAKGQRQVIYRVAVDELEIRLAAEPNMPEAARKLTESKIAGYKSEIARLDSEPQSGDGKKELTVKARALEHERDEALRRDPNFDFAQAFLQIAIVLASAFIIFSNRLLIGTSLLFGGLGAVLTLNGFVLLV